jgi:High potential iron-sulfur protein
MNPSNRRIFVIQAAAVGAALCGAAAPARASKKKVEESEPKAVQLGYKHDTANVDKKRFPKHAASEKCNNCVAWLGKAADPWAECDLLADRLVSNGGWCSSYVKA